MIRPLSIAAADRELTGAEAYLVRSHLEVCETCRTAFARDAEFIRAVRKASRMEPAPETLRIRMQALLHRGRTRPTDA